MQRWLWPLMLGVAFSVGLVAGMTRPRSPSTEHDIAALQRHIGTLQEELRARDATVAALQHQLQATASTAVTTPTALAPPAPPAGTAPPPPQAASPPRATAASPSRGTPVPERTQEAALALFHQYQQHTAGVEGPARRRQERALLESLLAIGPPAVDALLQVLRDSVSGEERRNAASLLGGLQDPRAIPALLDIVHTDEDILTRRTAVRGLVRLQLPETVPALEAVLTADDDRFVRISAAYGLAQLGQPQGVTELMQVYHEATRDGHGRFLAFQSLAALNNARVLPLMHEIALKEPEVGYRLRAIQFIAKHGDQHSLALLQEIMANPNEQPSLREAAAQASLTIPRAAARPQ